jgi:hypothetical protein
MKNYKLIGILIFFISCSNEKKIEISGYAYQNENIQILENQKVILNIQVNNDNKNMDANKLCSFYELNLKISNSNVKLNIKIDSSNISVLDTCLIVPKELKSPFITFSSPSVKSKFKRIILLDDESKFSKY